MIVPAIDWPDTVLFGPKVLLYSVLELHFPPLAYQTYNSHPAATAATITTVVSHERFPVNTDTWRQTRPSAPLTRPVPATIAQLLLTAREQPGKGGGEKKSDDKVSLRPLGLRLSLSRPPHIHSP